MNTIVRFVFVLFLIPYIGGCSSLPNGKFSPSFDDYPVKAHLVHKQHEKPVRVIVPQMQVHGGGLIGAVVAGVANGVSASKRSQGIQEINASFSLQDYDAIMHGAFKNNISSSSVFEIHDYNSIASSGHSEGRKAYKDILKTTQQPYVMNYRSYAAIGEFYHNLTHVIYLEVLKKEADKETKIFHLTLSDIYVPEEISDTESLENYRYWTKDNAALIKKALRVTKVKLEEQLERALKDSQIVN